jgi:hypothetical protein
VNFDHGAHVFYAFKFSFKFGCDNSAHNMDFCFLVSGICVALALCIVVSRDTKNCFFNYTFLQHYNYHHNELVSMLLGELCYLSCT